MRYILALALALFMSSPVLAAFDGPGAAPANGGFQGPTSGSAADTVAAVKTMRDDTRVVLTGNIVSKVAGSKDEYMFKDATGEIQTEISDKVFGGLRVTPETKVRIYGKVDKDFGKRLEIDVKNLEIVQ